MSTPAELLEPVSVTRRPLRFWPRLSRYLAVVAAGAMAWVAEAAVRLMTPLTEAQEELVGAALVLDVALGLVSLALLPLRRRHPLLIASLTTAVSAFSASSLGA